MSKQNRRDFLLNSSALAAAMASAGLLDEPIAWSAPQSNAKRSANETLRVACIGVRSRGRDHVHNFAGKHNCIITHICDADEAVIGPAMKHVEKVQGKAPQYVKDLRRIMEDKSIDIVATATPNHWHALIAIWAMQNGKDVYVEKPVSHNVSEGRRIVEAARKYNRICQTGTQSRSQAGMRAAIDFVLSGKLGKVQIARGLCYKRRGSIGKVDGPQPIPKTVDYDLWCGPAPKKPLLRKNLHYDWHWIWDYGNGDLGNQGIHEMDKARWGINKNTLPKAVLSLGGRFGYVDDGQTANTQLCFFDYDDVQLIFEVRGLNTDPLKNCKIGNIFHCEKGYLVCPNYYGGAAFTHDGQLIEKFTGRGDHYANFVEAVRSRNASRLNADILEGHLSSALCHLGNISYRLGTLEPFNKESKAFGDNKDAYEAFERMCEHLKANMIPLDKTQYRLGRRLQINADTETFVGDKEANQMLSRDYRKGFEVPDKV
ncbi:MAG: NADH-dependent dehydrogenase [Gemmatales bacterium]|nr:MAG: NADH-dependent dehydrogenase [Gemmatales bacterium]